MQKFQCLLFVLKRSYYIIYATIPLHILGTNVSKRLRTKFSHATHTNVRGDINFHNRFRGTSK